MYAVAVIPGCTRRAGCRVGAAWPAVTIGDPRSAGPRRDRQASCPSPHCIAVGCWTPADSEPPALAVGMPCGLPISAALSPGRSCSIINSPLYENAFTIGRAVNEDRRKVRHADETVSPAARTNPLALSTLESPT